MTRQTLLRPLVAILTAWSLCVTAQAQSFLTNGLVTYLTFEGNVTDVSGNGNDGQPRGDATFMPDRFGNPRSALSCAPGLSTGVQQQAPNTFSLCSWFRFPAGSTNVAVFFFFSDWPIGQGQLRDRSLNWLPEGQMEFYLFPGRPVVLLGPAPVADGRWHQVVTTLSMDGTRLFLDGSLIAQDPTVTAGADYRGTWTIGCGVDNVVDEVRIYDRALTPLEVQVLFAYESVPPFRIAVQPQSQTNSWQQSVTLSVTVTNGTPPYAYQWFKNDQAMPGATQPILTLDNLLNSHQGAYRVRIMDASQTLWSDVARVTVSPVEPFFEDFETGLGRWTGQNGGSHHGVLVPDPIASGRGHVLTFDQRGRYGDLFSTRVFHSPYPIAISFDYLGLAQPDSLLGDLGGFFGISTGLYGATWLAATADGFGVKLLDDGQWHRVTRQLNGPLAGDIHLVLMDALRSSGVAGDVYFDNISVSFDPEPTAPPQGLVAWWSGDSGAKDVLKRANGMLVNGAGNSPGLVGNALSLPVGAYVGVPYQSFLAPTRAVTVEAWINQDRQLGTYDPVLSTAGCSLEFHGTGVPSFWINLNDGSGWKGVWPGLAMVPTRAWTHVAGTYDGLTLRIYVNGLEVASTPASGQMVASTNDLLIGGKVAIPDRMFTGMIDEACLYDRALSAGEILAIYASGGKQPNPISLTGPGDQNVLVGDAAHFAVTPAGQGPFGYEWRRDGVTLAGESGPALTIAQVQPEQSGAYSVIVTNSQGAVATAEAMLRVHSGGDLVWDFENAAGLGSWSSTNLSTTPVGARGFLGEFGNQAVSLSLTNLPSHNVASIECDLLLIRSWDGTSASNGPDLFNLQVVSGPSLLKTSFGAHAGTQSFPADYPQGSFPSGFDTAESDSMGFPFRTSWVGTMDAVYTLRFDFAHTADLLGFTFSASGLEALTNESWGLDNVRVSFVTNVFGLIQLETAGKTVEDAGAAIVNIQRIGGTNGTVSVSYATVDESATAGVDYMAARGTVIFAAGETLKTISIPILGHNPSSGDRIFRVALSAPTGGAVVGANATMALSIAQLPTMEFFSDNYFATEIDGTVSLPIARSNVGRTCTVGLRTSPVTAVIGRDYLTYSNNAIAFNATVASVTVSPTLQDNTIVDGNRTFRATLFNPVGCRLGTRTNVLVTILDNDTAAAPGPGVTAGIRDVLVQPDGKILLAGFFDYANGVREESIARLLPDGSLDEPFNLGMAFNNGVDKMALQPDGKVIAAGVFTQVYGLTRNRIVRLQAAGGLDPSFSATVAPDNRIYSVAVQPDDGKILIAGLFANVNGTARSKVARLNANGTLDTTFVPPAFSGGGNTMWAVAVVPGTNQQVLCGGNFAAVAGGTHPNLVRLDGTGAIDATFNPGGAGPNGAVYTILALPSGKLLIGGDFTTYNGVARNRITRLNANGTLDTTFAVGTGADSGVARRLAVLPDGRVYITGAFQTYNGVTRRRIARINTNGGLDATFNPIGGANATTYAVAPLADGRVVVAGDFTVFNGNHRSRFAILNSDGSLPPEPPRWVQWRIADGGNGHWYSRTPQATTWPAAESEAQRWGAHLVSIQSLAEQRFLQAQFLVSMDLLRPFWIGLSDEITEGTFAWSSREPLDFGCWFPGEPNDNGTGGEDYIAMNWQMSQDPAFNSIDIGGWNDVATPGTTSSIRADGPYFGIMESVSALSPDLIAIVSQPQDVQVSSGSDAGFHVSAVGAPPLAYQWQHNGTNVPGAIGPSLWLPAANSEQAGVYSVSISNAVTSIQSSNAVLHVQTPPVLASSSITNTPDGVRFSLTIGSTPGQGVAIQSATNLSGAPWMTLAVVTNTVDLWPYVDVGPDFGQRFYRLAIDPIHAWAPLSMEAFCNAQFISTATTPAADLFTYNGGTLASAGWLRKNAYAAPGVPDDGFVPIPGIPEPASYHVTVPAGILITGPKGRQPQPVTVTLARESVKPISQLAILHATCWGHGTVRVTARYTDGTTSSHTLQVADWNPNRAEALPAELSLAIASRDTHPQYGAPTEVFSQILDVDGTRSLSGLSFEVSQILAPAGIAQADSEVRFTVGILAISAE